MNIGTVMGYPAYAVWNWTDGVYATPRKFASRSDARDFVESFRKRYKEQGYYLTSSGLRIAPKDIELVIERSWAWPEDE